MKKKSFLFSLCFCFFIVASGCYGQTTFQKVIYANGGSGAYAVQQTNDGGYIISGYTLDPVSNNDDVYLIKTDNQGDTLWTKTFGGFDDNYGNSVQQTNDGGYIIAGSINSFGPSEVVYIIKTDAAGDTLWTMSYGDVEGEAGYSVQQTNDGGYIIAGSTNSFGAGETDAYLVKIDSVGDIIWSNAYGGTGYDEAYYVRQTSDKGYIVCGSTTSFGAGNDDIYLVKTNANGDTLWTKAYGGTGNDYGQAVQQTSDGGYIVAGYTLSFGAGNEDAYIIKTKPNGDTLWTKTYGGLDNDEAIDIQQTSDSGYIIGGFTSSFGAGSGDVYLIKTDVNGNTLWSQTFGGVNNDEGYSFRQTNDGGYIISGTTVSFVSPQNVSGVYLIKTDANGSSGCNENSVITIVGSPATQVAITTTLVSSGSTASPTTTLVGNAGSDSTLCLTVGIRELSSNNIVSIYPNPATNELRINNAESGIEKQAVYIQNMLGQTVCQSTINSQQSTINVSFLPAGIYFVRVVNGKGQWVGKFIKE